MNILGIDSSGLVATTALLCDDILVGEYTIHNKMTHSQTLLPMIHDMMEMAGFEKENLDAVAVASGPGSFTGLRIGAAVAKGIAYALDIDIVPVPTLMGLAYNFAGADALVCPLMDARRNQAYYGIYDVSGDTPVSVEKDDAKEIGSIIEKLNELNQNVIFLGDGVPVFRDFIENNINVSHFFANDAVRYQRASSVAAIGKKMYEQGKSVSASGFAPEYLRKSQAEREREEKNN